MRAMRRTIQSAASFFLLPAGIILLFSSGFIFPLAAGEPLKDPILRVEAGMHAAAIHSISVDAENRFLVTASNDKTVRIWELPGLGLVRTLRPPIGEGHEGKIIAVAISPDGNTIAAGGWTGGEWEKRYSIYLFDRAGRMSRPKGLQGLPHAVKHLTYSRDGSYLAACLGGANGIRIYRTAGYAPVKEDAEYRGDCYGADFSRDGRLVTVSYDGFIRLYDKSFTRIAKVQAPVGKQPYSVSFSPDGAKIAIGYVDTTRVDVFSGKDLSYLFSPDKRDENKGNSMAVAWSSDGSLYGGGWSFRRDTYIFKWAREGMADYQVLAASGNTIMQILPLKDGAIAFGAADPAFGIFDRTGTRTSYIAPVIPDFRGSLERFLLSRDGSTIQVGFEPGGKSPARFSIKDRLLTPDPADFGTLAPPAMEKKDLQLRTGVIRTNQSSTEDPYNFTNMSCLGVSPSARMSNASSWEPIGPSGFSTGVAHRGGASP